MTSPDPRSTISPKAHVGDSYSQGTFTLPKELSVDALDILPHLSSILSRLKDPANTTTASTAGSPPAPSGGLSTPLAEHAPLSIRDVPAATDKLKQDLHKARIEIQKLPDMERTVEEQDMEIKELEMKIVEQRGVLERLKDVGRTEKGLSGMGGAMEGVQGDD